MNNEGLLLGHINYKPSKLSGLKALFNPRIPAGRAARRFIASFLKKPQRKLVQLNAVHTAVFAPSGAGKNVSIVEPFLLSSRENAVVIDIKGENARITAGPRARKGHKIVLLDPFKEVTKNPAGWNPLDILDPDDPDSIDQVKAFAHAIVVKEPSEKEPFWTDSGRLFITGAILAVINFCPPGRRSFQEVAGLLAERDALASAIKRLIESDKHSGLLARIGHEMSASRDKQLDGILSTCSRFLSFLGTVAVLESTRETKGFTAADLDGKVTVYLIIPANYIRSHAGLMRLWLAALMQIKVKQGLSSTPLNMVLDEAAQLGPMDAINDMLTIGRGYGVKLTLIYQSMGQLAKLFPEDQGTTLLSNTTQVFFAVNDRQTAEYVSQRLGKETIVVTSGSEGYGTNYSASNTGTTTGSSTNQNENWNQMGRELLQPNEITSLDKRIAITFHPGCLPIVTYLTRYYEGNPESDGLGFWKVLFHTAVMFSLSLGCALMTAAAITGAK